MKKKILVCMLAGAFTLTLGTSSAYAARGNNYVNKNGYGICGNVTERPNYVDEDNDGVCDNQGERLNYVDEDNDGICDNSGTQSGCGRKNGYHGKRNR